MTASPAENTAAGKEESAPGVLLYLPFHCLPKNSGEMLDRMAGISGIQSGDLRYKMVGRGIARLTPALPLKVQKALADEMNDMGIPAAVVPEGRLRRRLSLPLARSVDISDKAVVFFDRDDQPVFTIDKSVDILAVITDLSGRSLEKAFIPGMDQAAALRSFEDALKKISVNRPATVFAAVGTDPPVGVIVDHAAFSYQSLEEFMDISAGVNFRTLVNETIRRAKSAITDHRFGGEPLGGAIPDWDGSKRDILSAFGRYTLYVLAAAESGILRPGGKGTADGTYSFKDDDADEGETAGENLSEGDSAASEATLPQPPDAVDYAGIMAVLRSGPREILYSLLFSLAPFFSHFVRAADFQNPFLWKTLSGGVLLAAGLFLFPYSLVVLHYKRMIQNTPTSKVRSAAMGTVELEGRARRYYDLKTSHSRTKCIYYRARYYRVQLNRNGYQRKLIRQTSSGRLPFYLEDPTGKVMIDPEGAQLLITQIRQEFDGAGSMWLSPSVQDSQTRIHEELIPEGTRIYVLGSARPEQVGASIAEKLVDRLRLLKSEPERLDSYDNNGDGRIDVTEWEAARADAEQQVYAESLLEGAPGERIVIRKPLYGLLPFIIADTEKKIIRKLAFRVWIFLIGGLMMIGLGTEMLISLYRG